MNRRRNVLRVTALLWISLVAAGCGHSASSDSTGHSPRPGGLALACAKIPATRIEGLVRAAGGDRERLRRGSGGSAELSRCIFRAPGVNAALSLDGNRDAVRGYFNRMTEFSQFGSRNPGLRPQPVPGLGDRGTSGFGANWVPALDQLFSVRERKLLVATFYVRGAPARRLRGGAIGLSRLAYAALGSPRAAGSG